MPKRTSYNSNAYLDSHLSLNLTVASYSKICSGQPVLVIGTKLEELCLSRRLRQPV